MNKEFLMWKRFLGIMAAALCVLNLTVGSAFSADLVKVPTAWLDEHETFLMWYAKEKGWDKEAGLDIEMKLFNSGPDILNALPAGEWRFAAVGALPAMLGNLRYGTSIIAQANNEAALCTSVVVRADSPIAKVHSIIVVRNKIPRKTVVTTTNGLFPVLGAAVQNRGTQGIASAP